MERIQKLQEFLSADSGDPFLKHALALEYVKAGDDNTAKKLFEEILTTNPSYVGSYYHLAKLLERQGEVRKAAEWYEKGMDAASEAGDKHSLNELRMAYEDLIDEP